MNCCTFTRFVFLLCVYLCTLGHARFFKEDTDAGNVENAMKNRPNIYDRERKRVKNYEEIFDETGTRSNRFDKRELEHDDRFHPYYRRRDYYDDEFYKKQREEDMRRRMKDPYVVLYYPRRSEMSYYEKKDPKLMSDTGNTGKSPDVNVKNVDIKQHTTTPPVVKREEQWKPWVATMIAITLIVICAVAGIFTGPITGKPWFPYLIIGLIALGVSVLIGDAVMHLIPHALGLQLGKDPLASGSIIWKEVLVVFGLYIFFMFEVVMHSLGNSSEPSKDVAQDNDGSVDSSEELNSEKYGKGLSVREYTPVIWNILVGGAIHNFLDGVAVGAAFSVPWPSGYHGGISTSVAIFCHEPPHELGEFAVLLSQGLSIKQSLITNLISSLPAFVGGMVGIVLGTQWSAAPYILAMTSGMFFYIALADMLPELLRSDVLKLKPVLSIFIANVGMITGFVIMFVIALGETMIPNTDS